MKLYRGVGADAGVGVILKPWRLLVESRSESKIKVRAPILPDKKLHVRPSGKYSFFTLLVSSEAFEGWTDNRCRQVSNKTFRHTSA